MNKQGEYATKVAQWRFDSWNAVLHEAVFNLHKQRNISEEELLQELAQLRDELDHVPSSVEMRKHGGITIYPYLRRYGSWKQAVEATGMEYRGHPSGPDHPTWKEGYGDISWAKLVQAAQTGAGTRRIRVPDAGLFRRP